MTTYYGRDALSVLTLNASDYDEISEGGQMHYNHIDCPMGADTKRRLYVKNVDGAYLWHCHNCSDSGYYRPKETLKKMKDATYSIHKELDGFDYGLKLAKINNQDYEQFDLRGQMWLSDYDFNSELCHEYGIVEDENGVMLPVWNQNKVCGYQHRRYDRKPKYMTYTSNGCSYLKGDPNKPLIFVEDLLSSYKLHSVGYSSLCLLGTKLDFNTLMALKIDKFDKVVLWLDADEAGEVGTLKIYRELAPLVRNVTSMHMQQPKEIPIKKLSRMDL
jgi:hypothetical protein